MAEIIGAQYAPLFRFTNTATSIRHPSNFSFGLIRPSAAEPSRRDRFASTPHVDSIRCQSSSRRVPRSSNARLTLEAVSQVLRSADRLGQCPASFTYHDTHVSPPGDVRVPPAIDDLPALHADRILSPSFKKQPHGPFSTSRFDPSASDGLNRGNISSHSHITSHGVILIAFVHTHS